ncbi:unnamed protein product [Chrysodeixis includens]|uniref:STING ligand-binding domain-containing protein n=1 Tax=Chrysodeixis includens TaxID=689277 RepID=A0A9P0FR71_CHRIL|nr:unnamed protein product [Chrysodeixis includens]
MDQIHIFIMQILFLSGITVGSKSFSLNDKDKWAISIARYVIYVLTIQGTKWACAVLYDMYLKHGDLDLKLLKKVNRHHVMLYLGSVGFLVLNEQTVIDGDFPQMLIASLIVKYPVVETKSKTTVNYGVGMACSFFEGYLVHVLPSDGARFVGFEENIRRFESQQGVVFPVKKLFVIVTKSLFSPPDLKQFNKCNREGASTIEACRSLDEVEKDVAGVRGRIYKNTAYKIYRRARRPVCVAAECATLIHTLYRVTKNRDLYEVLADVNVDEIVADFINTLRKIIANSPECRGKCEIIYFDDTNPELNFADVLLDRIREIEPNFENLIDTKASE